MDAGEVADRFGLAAPVRLSDGPVARGRQGLVWWLETADGLWAVKTTFRPVGEDEVATAAALQEAAWAAGVPCPRVRRTTDGRVFGDVGGVRIRVYEWVDLLPPDPLADPVPVGRAVAALHGVVLDGDGVPEAWSYEPVGAERWDALVTDLRAAGAPFAASLAALRDELVALESWLEPPELLRVCHGDLWADNVLPTADGGVCVIDFENAQTADPAHELGMVLFEFGRTDPGRARALVEAYRDAGGTFGVTRRGHFTMLIAQQGHITEIAARDWLQPNERSPDRAAAESWVRETLDDPHTRAVLDGLLAAVGS